MRFLFVDGVSDLVAGSRIVGWKNVAMSEDYLEWHFPEKPIVPGVLVLEAFAQLAGWLEAVSSDFDRWVLLDRVTSARYYSFSVPGDRIELELTATGGGVDVRRQYRGESRVRGARSAVVEFECRVVPLDTLESVEDSRLTWSHLCGELQIGGTS